MLPPPMTQAGCGACLAAPRRAGMWRGAGSRAQRDPLPGSGVQWGSLGSRAQPDGGARNCCLLLPVRWRLPRSLHVCLGSAVYLRLGLQATLILGDSTPRNWGYRAGVAGGPRPDSPDGPGAGGGGSWHGEGGAKDKAREGPRQNRGTGWHAWLRGSHGDGERGSWLVPDILRTAKERGPQQPPE